MDGDETRRRMVWCGNLSPETSEKHLYELFLQVGPLEDVRIPKDNQGGRKNFGFVTFKHQISVAYAIELLNGINLNGRPLRLDGRDGNAKDSNNPYTLAMQKHFNNARDHHHHHRGEHHHNDRDNNRNSNGNNRDGSGPGLLGRYDLLSLPARNHNMQQQPGGQPPAPGTIGGGQQGNWQQQIWDQNGAAARWGQDRGFSFQMTSFSTSQAAMPQQFFMYGQNSLYPSFQHIGIQNRFIQNFQSSTAGGLNSTPPEYYGRR